MYKSVHFALNGKQSIMDSFHARMQIYFISFHCYDLSYNYTIIYLITLISTDI